MNGAASLTLEPLDLAVLTLAPSVVYFSGFVDLLPRSEGDSHELYTRDGMATFLHSALVPVPDLEEGMLSGIRIQRPAHRDRDRAFQVAWRRVRTRGSGHSFLDGRTKVRWRG
jgi:hypothetical protein